MANKIGKIVEQIVSDAVATGQVALNASTPTLIAAARPGRQRITITNDSSIKVYIGGSTVATNSGDMIAATSGSAKTYHTEAALYGIAASGTPTVTYLEEYVS